MGAKQRAQARGKKKAGSQKGSPWSQKQSNPSVKVQSLDPTVRHRAHLSDWQDFSDSNSPQGRNGFSMNQQARNTERGAYTWGTTKLREQTISFVSAGTLVREEPESSATENDSVRETSLEEPQDRKLEQNKESLPQEAAQATDTEPATLVNLSINDESESISVAQPMEDATEGAFEERRQSVSTDASEEIIFTGRTNPTPKPQPPISMPIRSAPSPKKATSPAPSPNLAPSHAYHSPEPEPQSWSRRSRRHPVGGRSHRRPRDMFAEEEEALMQDYIANMAAEDGDDVEEDGIGNKHFRFDDGSAPSNVKVQVKRPGQVFNRPADIDQTVDWDSADLEDFDDLNTTDDEITEIGQVLRHRSRPTGLQYLVTAVDVGASDAKWVLSERLTSVSAIKEITMYEDIRSKMVEETTGETDEETDSELDEALNDLVDDIVSEDEENQRILEITARMTDEQIARALAKQEEFGLDADELLLFNGEVDNEDDEFADDLDFIPFSSKQHLSSRGKSNRSRKNRESFPPAEAFADALEQDFDAAFDIMDFDRPSLRPRKKGRKSDLPFDMDIEDDELREQLRSTWNRDREQKAARKRERQEAQEAMLLNASARNDPAAIKAEIRQFLVQESDSLTLAPMDATLRASIHRLAKALRLHSRSEGKDGRGGGRFPVLTKTPKTPYYTVDTIWEIDALMNLRKFFPKSGGGSYRGVNATRTPANVRARRGGGGVMSGATYMNGEVVGASAPEIGANNKGRAMLEKMGWTSGTGIGAVGNKGGLEAIKHVVKTTRAGLG